MGDKCVITAPPLKGPEGPLLTELTIWVCCADQSAAQGDLACLSSLLFHCQYIQTCPGKNVKDHKEVLQGNCYLATGYCDESLRIAFQRSGSQLYRETARHCCLSCSNKWDLQSTSSSWTCHMWHQRTLHVAQHIACRTEAQYAVVLLMLVEKINNCFRLSVITCPLHSANDVTTCKYRW